MSNQDALAMGHFSTRPFGSAVTFLSNATKTLAANLELGFLG
jgi:hypothetical protein